MGRTMCSVQCACYYASTRSGVQLQLQLRACPASTAAHARHGPQSSSARAPARSSQRRGRRPRPGSGTAPGPLCPISAVDTRSAVRAAPALHFDCWAMLAQCWAAAWQCGISSGMAPNLTGSCIGSAPLARHAAAWQRPSSKQVHQLQPAAQHARTRALACMVTSRSSTCTSFVRKSAPMVALYWLLNFLFTYWFISDVLPTLRAARARRRGSVSGAGARAAAAAAAALQVAAGGAAAPDA